MVGYEDTCSCCREIRVANTSDGMEYHHKVVPLLNLHTAKLETPHGRKINSIV